MSDPMEEPRGEGEGLQKGDRVVIKRGHPWHGYSGVIVDADPHGPLQMLLVQLDNGQRCYAGSQEISRA